MKSHDPAVGVSPRERHLVVYLPCYNEEENIGPLMDQWLALEEELLERGFVLTVKPVDDGSTDGTREVIASFQREHTNIAPIFHRVNQNLGGVLRTSVHNFLDHHREGDLMCVMDGDNTHDPKYILSMLDALTKNTLDVVIASRYQRGSDIEGLAPHRDILSRFAKLYYSMILQIPGVRDYTCGYRLYDYGILKRARDHYGTQLIEESSFACMMELLFKLHGEGAKIGEIPFILRYDRKEGASKMSILKTSWRSLRGAIKLRKNS
ncbi:MAG: glycosyltransferase [Tissierellia bacterium]|nr:glycosyltransferase [Tissierellia bacterium]